MQGVYAGLSLLTVKGGHATKACGELLGILHKFILWRAKIHFQSKHLSMRHFEGFLNKYCNDKEATLMDDFAVISRELYYTQPSIQASQLYVSHEHVHHVIWAQTFRCNSETAPTLSPAIFACDVVPYLLSQIGFCSSIAHLNWFSDCCNSVMDTQVCILHLNGHCDCCTLWQ